jgi:acetylglutamate kinase
MSEQSYSSADVLVEALPYIKKFHGETIVIKYGGSVMFDEQLRRDFATDVVLLKYVGMHPVVVHGGGKEITRWMEKVGKKPVFLGGLRVTDAETAEITEMVLSGKINQEIVSLINHSGGCAVGLSGKDGQLFAAEKRPMEQNQDLGFVGDIVGVDTRLISALNDQRYIPVVSSVAGNGSIETLNINADCAATALASALKALKLIFLTDVDGVLENGELCSELTVVNAQRLLDAGIAAGGMRPKVEEAVKALTAGVKHVHIINGTRRHGILLEIFTDEGVGTKLVAA